MTAKSKRHKRVTMIAVLMVIVLFVWSYRELRPTVIFHTPQESKYLGKVSEVDGCIEKLYTENHIAKYRLPHVWNWNEDDEVAIFTRNHNDLFQKKDLDFWKLDVYLDEDGAYLSHTKREYCCGLQPIFTAKANNHIND